MQLLIDGKEIAPPLGFDRVGPLIDRVLVDTGLDRRVTSRVWVDGVELGERDLEALPQRATESVVCVEVETRPVEEAARRAVAHAAEYNVQVEEALRAAANRYRVGDAENGAVALAECLDALLVLVETLRNVSAFLPITAEIAGLERDLAPALQALETLQRDGDWIGIADLVEFELAESLSGWPAQVERFLDGSPESG